MECSWSWTLYLPILRIRVNVGDASIYDPKCAQAFLSKMASAINQMWMYNCTFVQVSEPNWSEVIIVTYIQRLSDLFTTPTIANAKYFTTGVIFNITDGGIASHVYQPGQDRVPERFDSVSSIRLCGLSWFHRNVVPIYVRIAFCYL